MRRRVWLLVGALAATTLIGGTGSFSAASMDRGVSVNVADHEDAYVGLADPGGVGVVTGEVACGDATGPQEFHLTVLAHGTDGGLTAEIDYPVMVVCADESSQKGNGGGAAETEDGDESTDTETETSD
jgi:hypothetical protein